MMDLYFDYWPLINITFAACFELIFGPRERPLWKRVLIWLGGGFVLLIFAFFVNLAFVLNINAGEGQGFYFEMLRLTGVNPDAPAHAFPEGDFSRPHLLLKLIAAGLVCGIPAAILLKLKKWPRFDKALLCFSLLVLWGSREAYGLTRRKAEGADISRRYYLACRAEIERIDALDIDEAERKAFYEAAMKKYYWTYENAEYNYRYMEQFLTRLKAYPPAPKE